MTKTRIAKVIDLTLPMTDLRGNAIAIPDNENKPHVVTIRDVMLAAIGSYASKQDDSKKARHENKTAVYFGRELTKQWNEIEVTDELQEILITAVTMSPVFTAMVKVQAEEIISNPVEKKYEVIEKEMGT